LDLAGNARLLQQVELKRKARFNIPARAISGPLTVAHLCDVSGHLKIFDLRGFMRIRHFLFFLTALSLAGVLTLSGCKHSTDQQANNQQTSAQPAATQPGGLPGVQTEQAPAAAQPAPENAGEPGSYQQQAPAGAAAAPAVTEIPAGTRLEVRLDQSLGSKISWTGESFGATVADDVVVDGATVIPRGARAQGKVIEAKARGRFKGRALLAIRLDDVRTDQGSYPVATSTVERAIAGKGRRTAKFVGGGAVLGGLIGGLAGGGKGLAIGAASGAGAGAAGGAFTGNKQIVLPAGTRLRFRLERPVQLTQG
jgi:hypothetical protein